MTKDVVIKKLATGFVIASVAMIVLVLYGNYINDAVKPIGRQLYILGSVGSLALMLVTSEHNRSTNKHAVFDSNVYNIVMSLVCSTVWPLAWIFMYLSKKWDSWFPDESA